MSDAPPPNAPLGIQFGQPDNPQAVQMQAAMQAALASQAPRFYANGLGLAMTPTDLVVTFLWNGFPACNLNFSVPFAKGMAEDLAKAVSDYERTSEQPVKTSGQIASNMQRHHSEAASKGDT